MSNDPYAKLTIREESEYILLVNLFVKYKLAKNYKKSDYIRAILKEWFSIGSDDLFINMVTNNKYEWSAKYETPMHRLLRVSFRELPNE